MSESRRFVLGVSYEGSTWQGWQTQPHGLTVQDTLESALSRFSNQPIHTICAGRTDTGVHAFEQIVHFDTTAQRDNEAWVRGVNALLPPSIAVRWAQETPAHFHARFSAQRRTYVYILFEGRVMSPFWKGKAGWSFRSLDLEAMQKAAQYLVGEHDFSSFRAASCQAHSPIRVLDFLEVAKQRQFFVFTLRANAFLHHMVRNIVGALVLIGQGKKKAVWMREVLHAKDRRYAAPTFSPDGLYLVKVDYPDEFLFPIRSFSDELGF